VTHSVHDPVSSPPTWPYRRYRDVLRSARRAILCSLDVLGGPTGDPVDSIPWSSSSALAMAATILGYQFDIFFVYERYPPPLLLLHLVRIYWLHKALCRGAPRHVFS